MMSSAVNVNHVRDCFSFAFHAFVFWVWGLRLHLDQLCRSPIIHIRLYPYKSGISCADAYFFPKHASLSLNSVPPTQFMWVWWFVAHHKNAMEPRCFLGLQSVLAADAVWAERFPPQEQHTPMLKLARCGCNSMLKFPVFQPSFSVFQNG